VIHQIKCQWEFFQRLLDGTKTQETRLNDRDYQVGDILTIRELSTDKHFKRETGRYLQFEITHILENAKFLQPGYCVMSIKKLESDQ
jgi:hypothetical protein